jgi:site-specific DNA-methyltransferase (adenine-specific)
MTGMFPIVIAMKPLDGNFAENAVKHGVAGLNVDAGRVATSDADFAALASGVESIRSRGGVVKGSWKNSSDLSGANPASPLGRWPANLIVEKCDEVTGMFPVTKNGGEVRHLSEYKEHVIPFLGGQRRTANTQFAGDSGSAARFFYNVGEAGDIMSGESDQGEKGKVMMQEIEFRNKLFNEDCLSVLRRMPDNCVTAVVTDPPYGLSSHPDMKEVLRHWMNGEEYSHQGRGFMSCKWDSFVPGPVVWREVLRVLKPGGHVMAFAGTRTQDLMGLALRLASFEIRDCMSYLGTVEPTLDWCYGSGFPKSLNIGKSLGKSAGSEREVVGSSRGVGVEDNKGFGGIARGGVGIIQKPIDVPITAPATDAAKLWDGYGTALKPAREPILVMGKDASELAPESPMIYTSKTSKKERNAGCGHLYWHVLGNGDYRQIAKDEYDALDEENKRNAESPDANPGFVPHRIANGNPHPTVKPIAAMRYLVKLCKMPRNNLILDPFMGSGSTLCACALEGCDFVGIDSSLMAYTVAQARVARVAHQVAQQRRKPLELGLA